jgi:hypothetical protein
MAPEFNKLAGELRAPGEQGRAIPGDVQAREEQAVPAPVEQPAVGRADISTYFTKAGGESLLYQAESWVYLHVTLLDAGPVSVGTRDNIAPVLSGKGGLLITNEVFRFPVQKGARVIIASNTINRVRIVIEPIPFGGQILALIGSLLSKGTR